MGEKKIPIIDGSVKNSNYKGIKQINGLKNRIAADIPACRTTLQELENNPYTSISKDKFARLRDEIQALDNEFQAVSEYKPKFSRFDLAYGFKNRISGVMSASYSDREKLSKIRRLKRECARTIERIKNEKKQNSAERVAELEKLIQDEILPLIHRLKISTKGIW